MPTTYGQHIIGRQAARPPIRAARKAGSVPTAIGAMLLITGILFGMVWADSTHLLNYLFPIAATLVAGLLYASGSSVYTGFVLWLWFLSPFIRRLLDYDAGQYTALSPVILTPLLASSFVLITVLRFRSTLLTPTYRPYAFVMVALIYAFVVGIIKVGVAPALYGLMSWIVPVAVGFHIHVQWTRYPHQRRTIERTFLWAVAILGLYGVIQFIDPPAWDRMWLRGSGMASVGHPYPYQMRSFSTLNSPGPFGMVMMAGLLFLLVGRSLKHAIAVAPGYASLLVSLVRLAWGAWFIGAVYILIRSGSEIRRRVTFLLGVALLVGMPLVLRGPGGGIVTSRVQSVTEMTDDNSFRKRLRLYKYRGFESFLNPLGDGIGSTGRASKITTGTVASFDSGIIEILDTLGWPGALLFTLGVGTLVARLFKRDADVPDPFALACSAIVLAFLTGLFFSNQFSDVAGFIFWSILGLGLAGRDFALDS